MITIKQTHPTPVIRRHLDRPHHLQPRGALHTWTSHVVPVLHGPVHPGPALLECPHHCRPGRRGAGNVQTEEDVLCHVGQGGARQEGEEMGHGGMLVLVRKLIRTEWSFVCAVFLCAWQRGYATFLLCAWQTWLCYFFTTVCACMTNVVMLLILVYSL